MLAEILLILSEDFHLQRPHGPVILLLLEKADSLRHASYI